MTPGRPQECTQRVFSTRPNRRGEMARECSFHTVCLNSAHSRRAGSARKSFRQESETRIHSLSNDSGELSYGEDGRKGQRLFAFLTLA